MREKDIERYLVKKIKELGGTADKFVSPGKAGVPDRVVCLPGATVLFVELKVPGKKISVLQDYRIRRYRKLGFNVCVIDDTEQIDRLIDALSRGE